MEDAEGIVWLIGRACSRGSVQYPENTTFDFSGGILQVDCHWRVVMGGRLRRTSADHGHWYGHPAPVDAAVEAQGLLLGRHVESSRWREGTSDLFVRFEGDVELEVVTNSAGYEPWNFHAPGVFLVAIGGGGIADFSGSAGTEEIYSPER